MVRRAFDEQPMMERSQIRGEDSRIKTQQIDGKLKKANEQNERLEKELGELKQKVEKLGGGLGKKGLKEIDFMEDLSRVFDDDRSIVYGRNMDFGSGADPVLEYDFKINLLENDLQSLQSENNSLVQGVLGMKQAIREKKAAHDEISTKMLVQKSAELKRELNDADLRIVRLESEIEEIRKRIHQNSSLVKNRQSEEGYKEILTAIQRLEKSNQKVQSDLKELTEKNNAKKKQMDLLKKEKIAEKASEFSKAEQENREYNELRMKHAVLCNDLKAKEAREVVSRDQSSIMEAGSTASKEHLQSLKKTNERLLSEIMRLNGVLKQIKKETAGRMNESLSISHIQYVADQSMDQSFMSKF